MTAQLVALVVGLVTNVLLTRHLGPEDYGYYGLVFAYVNLVTGVFANWGLQTVAVREASQEPQHAETILATAAVLQVIASLFAYFLLMLIVLVTAGSIRAVGVAIAGVSIVSMPLDMISLMFRVKLRLVRLAIVSALTSVIGMIAIFSATVLGARVLVVIIAVTIASLAGKALLLSNVLYLYRPQAVTIDKNRMIPLVQASWPIAIGSTLYALNGQMPLLLLSHTRSIADVGYVTAGARIANTATLVPTVIAMTLFPIFSHLGASNRDQLRRISADILRLMLLLAIPTAGAGIVFGRMVAVMIFGSKFTPAGQIIGLLTVQSAWAFPGTLAVGLLVALNRQRTTMFIDIATTPLTIGLSLWAIPKFGAAGAALTMTVGTAFAVICNLIFVCRNLHGPDLKVYAVCLSTSVGIVIYFIAQNYVMPDLLSFIFALAAYGSVAFFTGLLTPRALAYLRHPAGLSA